MKSIRFKILLMASVITLIVATVISFYGTFRARSLVKSSNDAYIGSLAQELSLEMDNFIQLQKGYLEGQVNALKLAEDFSETYMSAFTYNMSLSNPYMLYSYFNTLTDDGHFTSSDGWIPPEGYSWQDRYWVSLVAETDSIFVDFPSLDSGTGSIVTVIRKRVHDTETRGILNMAINLHELSEKLKAYSIPSNGEAFLIDENGLLVASHDPSLFENQPKALTIMDVVDGFDLEATRVEIGGKTYVSAALSDAPWTLWVCIPTAFFYNGVGLTSVHFFLIYLLTFFVSLIIANALSKKITSPIAGLKNHAELIGNGDYTQGISDVLLRQRDEIGQFAVTFEKMRDNILEREKELEHNYQEIQALYEEMAASEEALRENYDALNLYKDKVEYYAFHNAQTGFYNRDFLVQTLNKQAQSEALEDRSLICVSFKELNHYTQTVGQTVLELIHYKMGVALKEKVDQLSLDMVFDLAMGKFAILVHNSDIDMIMSIITELREQLANIIVLDSLTVRMTIICGAYKIESPVDVLNLGVDIVEKAESAMLRNQNDLSHEVIITWFDDEMLQKRIYDTRVDSGLFEAIERNEISVFYQAQYDLDRKVTGLEALMRWNHGKLGNIPPDVFIPRAENLGVIDKLDQFMIAEVLKFQSELKANHGISIPIAVNISVLELIDPQFVSRIEKEVQKYDAHRKNLIFEVTETAFSKHLTLVKDNIAKLMSLGYQVHLDDFGTGYSSLAYLSEFPVSAIKIDRTFVAAFLDHDKFSNVLTTMVDLAGKIDARVIAEGVETEEQLNGLKKLGCVEYQGYLLARPADKAHVIEMLVK